MVVEWHSRCGVPSMSNEQPQPDYRQTLHDSVVETANALVAGCIGVVEATRHFIMELDGLDDEDFLYFMNLDSQSDGFPVGVAREQWSATALEREDLEI